MPQDLTALTDAIENVESSIASALFTADRCKVEADRCKIEADRCRIEADRCKSEPHS